MLHTHTKKLTVQLIEKINLILTSSHFLTFLPYHIATLPPCYDLIPHPSMLQYYDHAIIQPYQPTILLIYYHITL